MLAKYMLQDSSSCNLYTFKQALTEKQCSLCCGEPPGACNSQACNGLNGICTGTYIGCPCSGVDFNAPTNVTMSVSSGNTLAASGFQANQSSTWTTVGDNQLMTETYLGITSNGNYGTDTIGLGIDATTGLTSNQNVVAGVLTEPFYLGQVGLKKSYAIGGNGNASLMVRLKDEKLIPSLSYGYTAGAIYRESSFLRRVLELKSFFRPTADLGKPYAWRLRSLAIHSQQC